ALKHGFDLVNLSLFDLEHFCELPGPGIRWAAGDCSAGGRLECTVFAERVVEEGEAEDEPAFLIDSDVPAIADPPHKMDQTRFKLLFASPRRRVAGRRLRIRPGLPFA